MGRASDAGTRDVGGVWRWSMEQLERATEREHVLGAVLRFARVVSKRGLVMRLLPGGFMPYLAHGPEGFEAWGLALHLPRCWGSVLENALATQCCWTGAPLAEKDRLLARELTGADTGTLFVAPLILDHGVSLVLVCGGFGPDFQRQELSLLVFLMERANAVARAVRLAAWLRSASNPPVSQSGEEVSTPPGRSSSCTAASAGPLSVSSSWSSWGPAAPPHRSGSC